MSGETERDISGWTTDTVHAELLRLMGEADRRVTGEIAAIRDAMLAADKRYEQRFIAQQEAVVAALSAAKEAVAAQLIAADRAVTKADLANEKRFDCVSADTPVLCADLIWRPAGSLRVGTEIIGVDENPVTRRGRRMRPAVVTFNEVESAPTVRVTTSHGIVHCTPNHPWLARGVSANDPWRWVTADKLRPGKDRVMRFIEPWDIDTSWDSGWLAGMFDGEGCLSMDKNGAVQLTLSQRVSATAVRMNTVLADKLGREALSYRVETEHQPQIHAMVCRRPEVMKILGSVRPPRLLVSARGVWDGKLIGSRRGGSSPALLVESVEASGSRPIARLSTSTHTYMAAGYVMHNSVNEFRATLADQAAQLMPRIEAEARISNLAEKMDVMGTRLDRGEGNTSGAQRATIANRENIQWAIGLIVLILAAVIGYVASHLH